jgi:hypothetical protein
MVESASEAAEMDWECPQTVLVQGDTDFEVAERDFAAAETAEEQVEIVEERAEMDSGEAEREVDSAEMDLPGMGWPLEGVESGLFAASGAKLKNSGCSDSAIRMGC